MCAEKWKENTIQIARLIMDMESRLMLQSAMKLVTPTITGAMAKVTHREHSGWGINTKETMNIAVDATMTFQKVFSNIAVYWSKHINACLYTIWGISHFLEMISYDDEILIPYIKSGKSIKIGNTVYKSILLCTSCLLYILHISS